MAQVRFLDQMSVSSFESGANETAAGSTLPRIILPGQSFRISSNTSVSTYGLTVAGTLILEVGPEIELPDGTVTRADSQLYVGNEIFITKPIRSGSNKFIKYFWK